MAKKHASEEARAEKAKRIDICLKESGVRQVAASRHCDVSTQAISNWRKYGQVEDENLFKLSELTGFRYVWLKNGSGERRYSDAEASQNRQEYLGQTSKLATDLDSTLLHSSEGERLLASLRRVHTKEDVNPTTLEHLANLLDCISGYNPPQKEPTPSPKDQSETDSLENCLASLARHVAAIQPELRSSVGELLKGLCERPDTPELIIQSILATAQVSEQSSETLTKKED